MLIEQRHECRSLYRGPAGQTERLFSVVLNEHNFSDINW